MTELVKVTATPEVVERLQEALESLESFASAALPKIHFKEGFKMSDDDDAVESFEGIIIHTTEMNAFYPERYKPGEKKLPTCFAPDGKIPITDKPQSPTCASCPKNQFGSAKEGAGKACKNVRPLYILVYNPETQDYGVIPRMLRIPPTSLGIVKNYVMNLAADYGSMYGVRTKFEVYKKSDSQTHYNIRFATVSRLTPAEKANAQFIRQGWMPRLKDTTVVMDEEPHDEPVAAPVPAAADGTVEPNY